MHPVRPAEISNQSGRGGQRPWKEKRKKYPQELSAPSPSSEPTPSHRRHVVFLTFVQLTGKEGKQEPRGDLHWSIPRKLWLNLLNSDEATPRFIGSLYSAPSRAEILFATACTYRQIGERERGFQLQKQGRGWSRPRSCSLSLPPRRSPVTAPRPAPAGAWGRQPDGSEGRQRRAAANSSIASPRPHLPGLPHRGCSRGGAPTGGGRKRKGRAMGLVFLTGPFKARTSPLCLLRCVPCCVAWLP